MMLQHIVSYTKEKLLFTYSCERLWNDSGSSLSTDGTMVGAILRTLKHMEKTIKYYYLLIVN